MPLLSLQVFHRGGGKLERTAGGGSLVTGAGGCSFLCLTGVSFHAKKTDNNEIIISQLAGVPCYAVPCCGVSL